MSYSSELAALNRTKIIKVEIVLDKCSRVYGVAPCVPIGGSDNCYNTYRTCVDDGAGLPKANFNKTTKTYKFTNAELPAPFYGCRPYLKSWNPLPQEIKDTITVKNRTTIEMYDDNNESDIDNDPYWSTRSHTSVVVGGSYFKRLFARNPNYRYRPIRVYEGFTNVDEVDYVLKYTGLIESVVYEKGIVKFECVDNLKSLELSEIDAPQFAKLAQDIDYDDTGNFDVDIQNDTAATSPGSTYVMIDDEIIYYTTKTAATINCTIRGCYGTTRAPHSVGASMQVVEEYNGTPAFILANLATAAGLSFDSSISDDSMLRAYLALDISVLIVKDKTKRSELFWEIVEQFGFRVWSNPDGTLAIRRTMNYADLASVPTYISTIPSITDALNILKGSTSVDLNEKSKVTRINRYWSLRAYTAGRKITSGINSSVTTIPISNATELPSAGDVLIDSEFITYTGTTTTSLTGCTRGARSSAAAAHSANALVYQSDLEPLKNHKEPESYLELTVTVDVNAETEHGKSEAKTFYSRWFNPFTDYMTYHTYTSGYSAYIDTMDGKMVASMVDPKTRFSFSTEIKDDTLKPGDFFELTTDDLTDIAGESFSEVMFQVVKKEPTEGNQIKFITEKIISLD